MIRIASGYITYSLLADDKVEEVRVKSSVSSDHSYFDKLNLAFLTIFIH